MNEVLFSSRMISMHSSTHSSQMNTVGPAISLRTSCWLFPQKEQYRVLLLSPLAAFVIVASHSCEGAGRNRTPRVARRSRRRPRAIGAATYLLLTIPDPR